MNKKQKENTELTVFFPWLGLKIFSILMGFIGLIFIATFDLSEQEQEIWLSFAIFFLIVFAFPLGLLKWNLWTWAGFRRATKKTQKEFEDDRN